MFYLKYSSTTNLTGYIDCMTVDCMNEIKRWLDCRLLIFESSNPCFLFIFTIFPFYLYYKNSQTDTSTNEPSPSRYEKQRLAMKAYYSYTMLCCTVLCYAASLTHLMSLAELGKCFTWCSSAGTQDKY